MLINEFVILKVVQDRSSAHRYYRPPRKLNPAVHQYPPIYDLNIGICWKKWYRSASSMDYL